MSSTASAAIRVNCLYIYELQRRKTARMKKKRADARMAKQQELKT